MPKKKKVPPNPPPIVIVGQPAPAVFSTSKCLVGSYKETDTECSKRGGNAHHIIPDEYLRNCNRDGAVAAAAAAEKTGTPDTSRVDDSFPTIQQGCCICVGGNANGTTAREARPTKPKGKRDRASILKKARTYAKATGSKNNADTRGHGFLHKFDHQFRGKSPTVDNALKTANKLLDQAVNNPTTGVTAQCAEKAKECIKKQFAAAKKKGAKLNKIPEVSEAAKKAHVARLRR